ncbi:helix-turn-helix domain-containing protein [Catellatospora sp. NPDC049609]|uniref:helix-turn-helix domain-containing protein n=1 Tax=Catellatospora sp. NPDC049609 TaxID=3155505 RepID=UPI00342F9A10
MTEVVTRRVIEDVSTLKALADPIRMAILELAMTEPGRTWTAKEFAGIVGISPTKIYYHLNLLEQHDLVQIRDTRVVNGIIEKQYGAGQLDLTFSRRTDDDGESLRTAVGRQFAQTRDEIDLGLAAGTMSVDAGAAERDRLLVSRAVASIDESRLTEFRQELLKLVHRFEQSSGPHRFGLLIALHPTRGE